jgi:hypothetical protein
LTALGPDSRGLADRRQSPNKAAADEKRERADADSLAAENADDQLPAPDQDKELYLNNQPGQAETRRSGATDQTRDGIEVDGVENQPSREHRHQPPGSDEEFRAGQAGQPLDAMHRRCARVQLEGAGHSIRTSPPPW